MNHSRFAAAVIVAAGFLFTAPALATGGDKPGCHGQNQEDCRPDPNPSGKDCDPHGKGGINDDHCATTTTTVAPTTTTTLPGLLPATTATTAAPTTATTAAPTTATTVGAVPKDSSVTVYGVNESRRQRRLADTGSPAVFYAVVALFAVAFGLALRYVGRLEHPSDG